MRLLDYFTAPLFYLQSPLPIEACSRRINDTAGSVLNPFSTGVAGFVWMSSIRLRYRTAWYEFGTTPVLIGRLDPMHGGTRFQLRIRAPMPAYFAAALAVPMLLLVIYLGLLAAGGMGVSADGSGPMLLLASIWMLVPILMLVLGAGRAQAHREALLDFLGQHAQAHPLAEHLRPQFPPW